MKRRTVVLIGHFARLSGALVGAGLIALGFGLAVEGAIVCRASEREP